jgi:hypothetical protein
VIHPAQCPLVIAPYELLPKVQLSPLMPPQQTGATVGAWIRDSVAWMQKQ